MPPIEQADIIIIGGGVIGTAIARELARYRLDILLVERQPDLAMGTSKANSGILHAGFDAHPDTLKGQLNARGNELYRTLEDELDLDIRWVGSLVVAKDEEDRKVLEELLERGRKNGVPGLEILPPEAVLAREPHLAPDITGALWAPSAGVICPFRATIAFAENAVQNGARVVTECGVNKIVTDNGKVTGVDTTLGFIGARYVINAAGVHADCLSRTAGDNSYSIKPRKGEYILFDKAVNHLVNTVLFPTPSKVSKGILVSPTAHGNLFIGPNAEDVADAEDVATSSQGLEGIIAGARRLVPAIPLQAAIVQFAGLRAAANTGDFIIQASETVSGLIHAAGIQSPGLSAAPAIAEKIVHILQEQGLSLQAKADFITATPKRVHSSELSYEERQQLIKSNPLYGRVICRCEIISEGEIVDAIHRPCGARTVDGVKRRTRAGSGRCQGGFCGPKVTAILARELGIPITAVRKDASQSYLFYDKMPVECEVVSHDRTHS